MNYYHLLIGEKTLAESTHTTRSDKLHVASANPDLVGAEIELVDMPHREYRLKSAIASVAHKYDFIILPTVPSIAGKIDLSEKDLTNGYLSDIYTVFANLAGIPAISLPLYKHSSGMVFGIQAMSSPKNELSLLSFSEIILKKYRI